MGQQAEGVGQGYAFSQQGGDDALPLVQRAPEPHLNQLLQLQLVTDAAKQLCLTERLCDHHEVVGIEILVEQVGAGAIDQHQLAELLQLVLGREGGNLYHGGVLLARLDCADDEVLLNVLQPLVIPYRFQAGQL
ncbi:hypothetical protein D3C72_870700 [compost metagenome]